ncbi:radical SAM/SPASM domain-containing protein [Peptacetobacter sp.]|uniref:radical SAM/SPASM domain-containing protein n=1 Tax=Peptacetobacter sp. TaxID=2991975 RepID=UPI0029433A70|nr:radical SAM protein [Peptacetobacter sp.]MEE0452179.1 radical SAM protein [Peptacetobacter sp.]
MKFTIFVTNACNLKCSYCYEGSKKTNINMDIKTAELVINFIKEKIKNEDKKIPLYIVFHGGEPLCNFETIKYIEKQLKKENMNRKIIFDITTNGTLMNEEITDFIENKITNISISIDGTKDNHDKNRVFHNGKGTYDIVIENSKKLLEKCKNIRVRMTIVPQNIEFISQGIEELIKLGFKEFVPYPDFMNKKWSISDLELLKIEINKFMDLKKIYKDIDISLINTIDINTMKGDCFGGVVSFAIDINGDIYPCTLSVGDKSLKMGNVKNNQIKDINKIMRMESIENKECYLCGRKEFCTTYRCKFMNKKVMGDINKEIPIMCGMERIYNYVNSLKK